MDDSFNSALRSPSNKQSPLMQFNEPDLNGGQTHFNQISNNNNNDNLFSVASKASIETTSSTTTQINQGSNDQLTGGSSSPHLSSNSSVSSHAQNNDDCDTAAQINNFSPSSPQSSYNSSFGSNSGRKLINSSNSSITALVPGGVVTTQNISTVIKPKSNNNSLQFVKIQTPELSKKAVEQIRIAEETKISKEKIKEVEEEWQNNLLNWKSKRRQQITHTFEPNDPFETSDNCGGRKIKTFAEMIEQRAKSGNRLGFHLQRYIGAEDDEDEGLSTAREVTSDFVNDAEQSKNRGLDSDCEAHSSTSSGYNQLDSKSPSSPDTPLEVVKAKETSNHTGFPSSTCDSNPNTDLPRDEKDNHSISLVESSESDKLNSTLIQGVKPPPSIPQSNNNSKHISHTDPESRSDDESDNSGFEEGDEEQEEEEQKYLQRIAFEEKLKAFENLTKPTTQKPRFTPNRVAVKNPLTQAKQARFEAIPKERQQPNPPRMKESNLLENLASIRPMVRDDRIQSSSDSSVATSSPDIKSEDSSGDAVLSGDLEYRKHPSTIITTTKPPLPSKEMLAQPLPKERGATTKVDINSRSNLSESPTIQTVDLAQRINSLDSRALETDLSELVSRVSNVELNSQPSDNMSTSRTIQSLVRTDSDGSQLSSQSGRETKMIHMTTSNSIKEFHPINNKNAQANFPLAPYNNIIQNEVLPHVTSNNNPIPIMQQQKSNNVIQKHQNVGSNIQPLPESPKSNAATSIQRKPSRDDKDRTVLSVSGKKRCSSCKEELGRGAAAFVVESLSLVYHTNCFRCSVCHVNLSNGFRGVDVRVHAGALHCQNCYSKDGLNYSRV